MADRTPCIKCGREIDEFARACPYCNWWQSNPVPPQPAQAAPPPVPDYVPPPDNRARNKLIGIGAFVGLVLLAFLLGALFQGSDEATAALTPDAEKAAPSGPPPPRTTVKLVPMTEGAPPPVFDSPVTGIEAQGATNTAGPADFTALPAEQYAAAAARTNAAQQQPGATFVDPRTITGSPYAAPAPRPAAQQQQPQRVAVAQTQPVPVFQPVPHVRVDREETARLFLTVGADGRVRDIDVARAAPGVMGPLVHNVQRWRFRPAMQNGQPVSSRFSVAITFKP